MLDDVTKKRINTLRQILVGKLPDPKAQVEQITNALIYKFMNDMDEESLSMGGKATYFSGSFQKYSWKNLMNSQTNGVEKLSLYADALNKMSDNENLPTLFRDIFKDSVLPFKDPATLNMFLKEIDEFHYSNSEKLGDAFEYLLSFMGSQGDAGQFRTPRHIIDFITEIVNPQKSETVLDPACGTAGFLISAYKHILKQNTKKNLGDGLNASDRKKIGDNLNGYDISPDMVKMSLVNMYLHKFTNPKINEYDTLSSEDRWNEYYDVILANPPFFSPKGGITPHNRFGVKSTKAEVLFIDYINEHLKPNGRAGIIVPEGIIFQNGSAYKQLRKKLIENSLIAVISLPSGVFNPYAGVKTSILILDKKKCKEEKNFYYFDVKNDGFTLNANRTPINKNDLPEIINSFKTNFVKNDKLKIFQITKSEILKTDTFSFNIKNLFKDELNSNFELKELREIVEVFDKKRKPLKKTERIHGDYPYYGATGIIDYINDYIFDEELVLVGEDGAKWGANEKSAFIAKGKYWVNNHAHVLKPDNSIVINSYIVNVLNNMDLSDYITGMTVPKLNQEKLLSIKIPIPSLEIQNQIVEELDAYQKIIDGCRQVIKNYKPSIDIDPTWEMVDLGSVVKTTSGGTPLKSKSEYYQNGTIPWMRSGEVNQGIIKNIKFKITKEGLKNSSAKILPINTVCIAMYGATAGKVGLLKIETSTNQAVCGILPSKNYLPEFLYYFLRGKEKELISKSVGGAQPNISQNIIKSILIPDISINEQKKILEDLIVNESTINANYNLKEFYTNKIIKKINSLWSN
ncbi:MAG: N-6 DNA methylase [Pelagibacteraceae bacterium]|nr:N-6 DNA methylase [Pelagibacteraceae bacterium]